MKRTQKKGFTLVELLVVVLILGILTAVALPAYMGSIKDARTKTANANAKMIATAIQAIYTKNAGAAYTGLDLANATVLAELGGSIPENPCSTSATPVVGDWTITLTSTKATVTPVNTATKCDTVKTFSNGS